VIALRLLARRGGERDLEGLMMVVLLLLDSMKLEAANGVASLISKQLLYSLSIMDTSSLSLR
jgi:hypothetical protein